MSDENQIIYNSIGSLLPSEGAIDIHSFRISDVLAPLIEIIELQEILIRKWRVVSQNE
jgi:hypothetical protein